MSPEEMRAARDQLAALVAAIDAQEVTADPGQRAYLLGAIDTLEQLLARIPASPARPVSQQPEKEVALPD